MSKIVTYLCLCLCLCSSKCLTASTTNRSLDTSLNTNLIGRLGIATLVNFCVRDEDCLHDLFVCREGFCALKGSVCVSSYECEFNKRCLKNSCFDLKNIGEPCESSEECASSMNCYSANWEPKVCTCTQDSHCPKNHLCSVLWHQCVRIENSCEQDSDCVYGKQCVDDRCRSQMTYKCRFNSDCDPGLACINQQCTNRRSRGDYCFTSNECAVGLQCIESTCLSPAYLWTPCKYTEQCQAAVENSICFSSPGVCKCKTGYEDYFNGVGEIQCRPEIYNDLHSRNTVVFALIVPSIVIFTLLIVCIAMSNKTEQRQAGNASNYNSRSVLVPTVSGNSVGQQLNDYPPSYEEVAQSIAVGATASPPTPPPKYNSAEFPCPPSVNMNTIPDGIRINNNS